MFILCILILIHLKELLYIAENNREKSYYDRYYIIGVFKFQPDQIRIYLGDCIYNLYFYSRLMIK